MNNPKNALMQKMTDKVMRGGESPVSQDLGKIESRPAVKMDPYKSDADQYKEVPFTTNNSDDYTGADKQKMLSWSNADRQELNARQNISKAKKHQQHPLFTMKEAISFDKKGQLDRYESSDHSSKTPNNPENEKYYNVRTSGTSMDPSVSHSSDPKPLSRKVKRFQKRETRREERILKKANKK